MICKYRAEGSLISIIEDDIDELEEALAIKDITFEQFQLAINTSENLKRGLLIDIAAFEELTRKCMKLMIDYN